MFPIWTCLFHPGASVAEPPTPLLPESVTTRRLSTWGGSAAVLASAVCFYLSTAVIRWAAAHVTLSPAAFVFSRFSLGLIVVVGIILIGRHRFQPKRWDLLIGRTITNTVAVYCFYKAVAVTTAAEANVLNMTYPIFIALFSWIWLRHQRDPVAMAMVGVAMVGIWLILAPAAMAPNLDHVWGVASGISAAAAIGYLNVSRQHHDPLTILLVMFGLGTMIMLILFWSDLSIPGPREAWFLFLCGGFGILGQFLLTLGFRYVTAVEGSVVSLFRILLAAFLGPMLAVDPPLSLAGGIGAILIFGSNVVVAVRRATGRAAAIGPPAS